MWPTFPSLRFTLSGSAPRRPASRRRPAIRRPSGRPRLEALEDRCLLSAGALDPTFGNGAGYVTSSPTNGADNAYSALIQPDGKILAAGRGYIMNARQTVNTATDFAVARYNSNGSLDTAFGSGGAALANFGPETLNPTVNHPSWVVFGGPTALYPQAGTVNDGKIVMAGWIDKYWYSGQASVDQFYIGLARFNANGTLDSTFGNQGEVATSPATFRRGGPVVIQPDGKIVVAGGTTTGFALARYNGNGTLDTSFGSGGEVLTPLGQWTSHGDALLLQPDGKLIVVGETPTSSAGDNVWEMARYNPNGSLDATFGNGGIVSGPFIGTGAEPSGAALYPSGAANAGKIIVAGDTATASGMARFNPDGSLDSTFGAGGAVTTTAASFRSVAIAADGKLVLGGNNSTNAVIRYNADGSPDGTFGTAGIVTGPVSDGAVALQPNGDIIVVAGMGTNGKVDFAVARYLPSEPEIGSFTASPNPVASGSSVTLTASNISDGNPGATITQVAFYAQVNGSNTLLGYGTQTSPGVWTFTFTVNLAPGTYTLYAQAEDSYGVFGDLAALTLNVQ
jgi:uncharacterized delta-60 repeat protein